MDRDRPDILIFPPLAFALALASAILLGWLAPLPILPLFPWPPGLVAGGVLIAAALTTAISGVRAFKRAGTNVDPRQPAQTIVRDGAYRYTRNPMYLGMVTLVTGYGLAASNLWGVIAAAALWAILHHGVVRREETYLEAKFGDKYRALLRATRRWL